MVVVARIIALLPLVAGTTFGNPPGSVGSIGTNATDDALGDVLVLLGAINPFHHGHYPYHGCQQCRHSASEDLER